MKPIWSGAILTLLALGVGILALSCKGKSNPVNPANPDIVIDIVADAGAGAFGASPDTMLSGQRVAWHNARGMTHRVVSNAAGVFDTGNISASGTSAASQLNTPGTFTYHCSIHPSMTGTLQVLP